MTNPSVQSLNMTDTEYATLIAKGYDPILEQELIQLGETPEQARKLAQFVSILQNKPPETEQGWDEFMTIWEDVCGYRPNFE